MWPCDINHAMCLGIKTTWNARPTTVWSAQATNMDPESTLVPDKSQPNMRESSSFHVHASAFKIIHWSSFLEEREIHTHTHNNLLPTRGHGSCRNMRAHRWIHTTSLSVCAANPYDVISVAFWPPSSLYLGASICFLILAKASLYVLFPVAISLSNGCDWGVERWEGAKDEHIMSFAF